MPPTNNETPEIVTLRDIYQQGQDNTRRLERLTGQVESLADDVKEDREERKGLKERVRALEIRVYSLGAGVVVISFLIANWSALTGMLSE